MPWIPGLFTAPAAAHSLDHLSTTDEVLLGDVISRFLAATRS